MAAFLTVPATAQVLDSTRVGRVLTSPLLNTALHVSQDLLLPHSTLPDSLIKALPLPTGVQKVAANPLAATVAMPVVGIVGSAVGLPLAGALALAGKVNSLMPVAQKINALVPEESRSYVKEQIGVLKQQLANAGKEDRPRKVKAEALPLTDMADFGIPAANYSGITPLGGDSFAVVDDKSPSAGFYVFHIHMDSLTGKILSLSRSPFRGEIEAEKADCEGIAYRPQTQTVFISDERTQAIREFQMDGQPTGHQLQIPPGFSPEDIESNAGFEALAYDSAAHCFWTVTENPLKADAPYGSARQQVLRLLAFGDDLQPLAQYPYLMEPAQLKNNGKYYAYGISALLAPGDGSLLILERELNVPGGYVGAKTSIRIFRVAISDWQPQPFGNSLTELPAEAFPPKQEIASFVTHINLSHMNYGNFEGMCLGPRLADGRFTLLLLSDSQAGAGNNLFHLKDYLKILVLNPF